VTLGASLVGVSGSVTVDSRYNVYVTTGVGAVLPSAGIAVGRFRSTGAPEDLFVGDSTCVSTTTPGAKLGMEACWNDSGETIGATAGVGSPHSLQKTKTRKLTLPKTDAALMEVDPMGNWTMPRASGM